MLIYHYDPDGVYVGSSEADPSPLEPGVFLIPARATALAPPHTGENEAAVFDGAGWTVKPDFRGAVYWLADGEKRDIVDVGEAIPADALSEPPPVPPSRADVFAERDRRLARGVTLSVTGYGDVPVQGRVADMIAYLSVKDMAQARAHQGVTDPVVTLRDAANVMHSLTPEQAIDLVSKAQAAAQAIYAASWAILDAADIPEDFARDARWP